MKPHHSIVLAVLLCVAVRMPAADPSRDLILTVRERPSPLVTIRAADATLGEIAERLQRELRIPVDVSPLARDLRVTLKKHEAPLDVVLRELAPEAYADATLTGGDAEAKIVTVYLRGAGEGAPTTAPLRRVANDFVVFEGHTEEPADVNPFAGLLKVTLREGRLSIMSKQQPEMIVAYEIAHALKIPVDLQTEIRTTVDLSLTDVTVEDAIRALTPAVTLVYRRNLTTFAVEPIKLVVGNSSPTRKGS